MGLIKSLPPRASKESDASILSKSKSSKPVAPVVKGGKGVYDSVSNIVALVASKLGKYENQYELIRDEDAVVKYFDEIVKNGIGAIDTETTSLDPMTCTLAGVCLYTPNHKPCYIPINHVSYVTGVLSKNQIKAELIKEQLQRCNDSGVKWVMHNSKYDTRVIRHQVGIRIKPFWDTYLAARCLNENESAALKSLHLKYCSSQDSEALSFDKLFDGVVFTQVPITTAYLYAAGDPLKTFELYEFQKKYLNRKTLPGCYNVFMNIEMPLVLVVADMEDAGVGLDIEYASELSEKYNKQLTEAQETFYSTLDMYSSEIDAYKAKVINHKLSDPVGIGSSTQIAVILYDILKVEPPDPKKPRGTGEDILLQIDSPICKAILDYRGIAKLLSTYIDKLPNVVNPTTGNIHCSLNQYGADTGRFSSSDPNLQNIPSHNKDIRKMFIPKKGHVLISSDFSQQEPRTLAHMSGDAGLKQAYIDGKDIYAWIASSIYSVPYDECKEFRPDGTKNPEGKKRRDSVKPVILGIMYGRGTKSIAEQLGITTRQAQDIIDKFFKSFPMVKTWMDEVLTNARINGYVETAWGRKRRLPDVQLEPYEFTLDEKSTANFDPLDFSSECSEPTIDEELKAYYIKKLESKWSIKDRLIIKDEARAKHGLTIKDNGGFIADAERQCVNSIIQGSAADMSKVAMILIGNDEEFARLGGRLLIPVHDELIAEAPIENAKAAADRMTKLMIQAAEGVITVPMSCDAEITDRWYGEVLVL